VGGTDLVLAIRHLIHANVRCVARANVALQITTIQPHRLGESIGQSAMQLNAR
jgi:hypothetical protein